MNDDLHSSNKEDVNSIPNFKPDLYIIRRKLLEKSSWSSAINAT
jgi:hypothetical protein